jgi:hypothetical protein
MRANVPSSRSHRHGASGPHFISGLLHTVGESSSCQTLDSECNGRTLSPL